MKEAGGAGPLTHVRVVELGSFIAGPYCGQLLADLGADVIKIEPPHVGDSMRQWGLGREGAPSSIWWSVIGRSKRSVTVDLRKPAGQDIVRKLVQQADVLIENFRPGTLEKWGLAPESLQSANPALIVTRVSGFGQDGPYSGRAGFAAIGEAMSGLRYLTGYPDRVPTRVGISIGDSLAGVFACIGVLAALVSRQERSGRGQVVDVSIAESILAVLESVVAEYSTLGAVRTRTGPILPGIAPSNLYPTADESFIVIAANADTLFGRLTKAMGRPELARDPRFATHGARGKNQSELDELIGAWTSTLSAADVLRRMEEAGVPAGPVNDASAVYADPHFRERGAIVDVPERDGGQTAMQGVFPKFSDTPGSIRWPGPTLGEHTEEILRERLGLTSMQISDLRATDTI